MQRQTLNVKLLSKTVDPSFTIALAGRLCYSDASIDDLSESIVGKESDMVDKLMSYGHFSTIEHVSFTFGIEGVSRALLAQLTRHRIASFSVQSQRYVRADELKFILPPSVKAEQADEFEADMKTIEHMYKKWLDLGLPPEDARFVLPNAAETKILMTMNARELLHFLELRTCNRAQWEIRRMAYVILGILKREAPAIFKDAGAKCITSFCTEGKKSCNMQAQVGQINDALNALAQAGASDEQINEFVLENIC